MYDQDIGGEMLELGVIATLRKLRAPEPGGGHAKLGRKHPCEVVYGLESAKYSNLFNLPICMQEQMFRLCTRCSCT